MDDKEKKAIKYFYNLRATIDESYMLFDKGINVKCEKEMIKQISIILNLCSRLEEENRRKDKIINLMAEDKYEYIDMFQMAKIGKEINYDPTKLFNGISDEETVKIIKEYFENKVKESK